MGKTAIRTGATVLLAGLVLVTVGTPRSVSAEGLAGPQGPDGPGTVVLAHYHLPLVSNSPPPTVYGVQTYWSVSRGLGKVRSMDVQWMRVQFSWAKIEPSDTTPENFDWRSMDAAAEAAQSADLYLVANIHGNPSWAARYPGGPLYYGRVADFVELMAAAAERYDGDGKLDAPGSPVILHWELYNEPDNASREYADAGYGYWGYHGTAYAALYRQVYPAMKAACPYSKLLLGGVAYERFREDDPDNPYVRRFLDDFFRAGGGQYIDIFNFHYYPNFAGLWEPYGRELIGKTAYFRSMLAQYGLNLPIVCTEIGQHSDTSRGGSDEMQSRYVAKTYVWAGAAGLEYVNWFALRDITDGYPYLYGLLDDAWQPKPSYYAFKTGAEQLGRAEFLRTLPASELGGSPAEGYLFSEFSQQIYVVWLNWETTRRVEFEGSSAQVVDLYGTETSVADGDDGSVDGYVTVRVGPEPVYIRPVP